VRIYRDAIEWDLLLGVFALTHGGSKDGLTAGLAYEGRHRAGSLWALKWTSAYCADIGKRVSATDEELLDLVELGATYEAFVDALKYAQHDLITITVDEASRTMVFYEGGPITAFDACLVERQSVTTPMTPHVSLTEDSDQLTSRWTAGDYRRLTKRLADGAAGKENTICFDLGFGSPTQKAEIRIPQPTVVWLERPANVPDCYVFDDLTLPTIITDNSKWKLVSLLETPIVRVGDRFCGLSSDIKTIAAIDDYMLRLAARVDPDQYSKATTLRERRMVNICRDALEQCEPQWSVNANVLYGDPPQEADVVARRGADTLILQLKSTLRPETPWEVYKRNEGLIDGVKHTRKLIDRGAGKQGFVITDGYGGDYSCWAEALTNNIPIATLYDIETIASDPAAAAEKARSNAGIPASAPAIPQVVPVREGSLVGWTLRFVDRPAPTTGQM
jgi:hypothetical protein